MKLKEFLNERYINLIRNEDDKLKYIDKV